MHVDSCFRAHDLWQIKTKQSCKTFWESKIGLEYVVLPGDRIAEILCYWIYKKKGKISEGRREKEDGEITRFFYFPLPHNLVPRKYVFIVQDHQVCVPELLSFVGYHCEAYNNPADFFLDIINGDSSAVVLNRENQDGEGMHICWESQIIAGLNWLKLCNVVGH